MQVLIRRFHLAINTALAASLFMLHSAAQTFTVLYSFKNSPDGAVPYAGLVIGGDGVLYGTTSAGGTSNEGTVFSWTPPAVAGGLWTENVLHSFTGPDGANPSADLIVATGGVLYGTTFRGGKSGRGTAFSLTPPAVAPGTWSETVLYSFAGGSDGANPYAGLVLGSRGVLYGTTQQGRGSAACSPLYNGCGTVFSLAPPAAAGGAWSETVLYSFTGGSDGANPYAGLLIGGNGALYGTTSSKTASRLQAGQPIRST